MWWFTFWIGVAVIGIVGAIASAGNVRFGRRVASEARELLSAPVEATPLARHRVDTLPAPVARYIRKAVSGRDVAVRTVRLRHGGKFRPSLDGSWLPIRGDQYVATNPPGFVWWGRVRLAPGLWIDARDRSVAGAGNMLVAAESVVTLANSAGPELDQGALLRLLGEMPWFPTAFLDERSVTWSAVDDRHAVASLRVGETTVSGRFEFAAEDLPVSFSAERYRDIGGGRAVLTPFAGEFSKFRQVDGVLVPHRVVAAWYVDGRRLPYADFEIERIEFDVVAP
jgi:hypothetical protein